MQVVIADEADIPSWLALAKEVEELFGPLTEGPEFRVALARNVARGTALCVREVESGSGESLAGGLLLSPHHPIYRITWLAVSRKRRGIGVGAHLVRSALSMTVMPPCTVEVTTFGPSHPGHDARGFYEHLGFQPMTAVTADGARQTYQLQVLDQKREAQDNGEERCRD